MPLHPNVHLSSLAAATAGWSGAEICELCRAAAMHALREAMDAPCVAAEHFEASLSGVRRGRGQEIWESRP
eukprot:scaffold3323_cov122-Isochrysis_galbana.AAC.2